MSLGVVADLPAGELEEQVLGVRRAVQVADGVVGGERVEQALRVAEVEEDGLAARLDAVGELAMRRRGLRRAVAVDLDDVALEVLGNELSRRAFGDLPA